MRQAALIMLVLATAALTADGARGQREYTPTVLWKNYPLRQHATTPVPTTARRDSPTKTITEPPHASASASWGWWVLLAVGAAALTAAVIDTEIYLSRTRRQGGHMTKFKLTRNQESEEAQPAAPTPRTSSAAARPAEAARQAAAPPAHVEPPQAKPDFDRLGTHVGSVLSAAEEAAARIQQEARLNARRVREQAEKESAALVETARRDAETTKVDAERARAEADEWAEQTRATAEDYAAEKRGEAEAEAAEIVRRAEQRAVTVRVDAERRQKALELDISHAENRLRELVTALHDLADRLDSVLTTQVQHDGEPEGALETLVEALVPATTTPEEAKT